MADPKKSFLSELKHLSGHFEQRKDRAKKRLANEDKRGWFFGIIGLECEVARFEFGDESKKVALEEVEEPPGDIELASALSRPEILSSVARYSRLIAHQIRIIEHKNQDDDQGCFNLAWWIISLIRVRTMTEFLVPLAANHSWSVIAGLKPNSCDVHFIEDIPKAKKLIKTANVSKADLVWVKDNLFEFIRLLEIPNFRLAVECLTTHQHQASDRMMAAMLWSGIEALFAIQAELNFRLAIFIACILERPGKARKDLYQRIRKLYVVRSKAVHGSKLSIRQIHEHVVEVRVILSRLLCLMIQKGGVYSEQEIEDIIFGVSAS